MPDKITSAFPVSALVYNYDDNAPDTIIHDGMTLRDYFAAKAMQGLVANNNANPFEISKAAYVVADEMMKARDR